MNTKVRLSVILLVSLSGMNVQAHSCSFAPAAPPSAQSSQEPQDNSQAQRPRRSENRPVPLFGKVTAIRDQSIEVAKPNGETVTVKITADTQFRREMQAAKLSDFKVGDIVMIRGQENPDHTWTAQLIGSRPATGPGGGPGREGTGGGFFATGELGKDYVFGEVKSIDAPQLTILRPDGVTQTIELNEDTSLRKGRESVTMADIQAGDHVFVRGALKDNVFVPKAVMVIGPEQWKRMQEMGMIPGSAPNPPKDIPKPEKPPEPRH